MNYRPCLLAFALSGSLPAMSKSFLRRRREVIPMRPICYPALALALLVSAAASAQPQTTTAYNAFHLEPGTYSVGFRLIEGEDPSRAVTGGGAAAPRPRPVRTYVWYPVEPARRGRAAEPMRFGRYVELADGDVWPAKMIGGLHEKLAYSRRPLARSFDEAGFAALSQRPVLAIESARPAAPIPTRRARCGVLVRARDFAGGARRISCRARLRRRDRAARRHELAGGQGRRRGPRDSGPRSRIRGCACA